MNLTASQIENIVRVVVERLRTSVAAPAVYPTLEKVAEPVVGEVYLNDRVVTLESLRGHLSGTTTFAVHPKAVVTPAVKDVLRHQNIKLIRQLPSVKKVGEPAPLLLVTSEPQLAVLSKRVCSQQADVIGAGDATKAVTAIRRELAVGKLGAVWCSDKPFVSIAATYGISDLRAMQLTDLRDLKPALEQAQPNVLILDSRAWHAAATANLVRDWYRSFR